jgi:hypothetical protein
MFLSIEQMLSMLMGSFQVLNALNARMFISLKTRIKIKLSVLALVSVEFVCQYIWNLVSSPFPNSSF